MHGPLLKFLQPSCPWNCLFNWTTRSFKQQLSYLANYNDLDDSQNNLNRSSQSSMACVSSCMFSQTTSLYLYITLICIIARLITKKLKAKQCQTSSWDSYHIRNQTTPTVHLNIWFNWLYFILFFVFFFPLIKRFWLHVPLPLFYLFFQ